MKNFKVSHRNMDGVSKEDVKVQHKNLTFHCLMLISTRFSIRPLNLMETLFQCYEFLEQSETKRVKTLLK